MKVQQQDNGNKGSFFIEQDGKRSAEMTYTWAGPNKFIIDHTEVADQLRGKGAGKKLLMKAISYAREHEKKILPLCPFAASVFKKNSELRDVL